MPPRRCRRRIAASRGITTASSWSGGRLPRPWPWWGRWLSDANTAEALGELATSVADQVCECAGAFAKVGQQVAVGLRRPGAVRIRGDPENVHMPGAHLHHEQDVEPAEVDRVDVEEVRGRQALGLVVQKRLPGQVSAHSWPWIRAQPHPRFSWARRMTRARISSETGGRSGRFG